MGGVTSRSAVATGRLSGEALTRNFSDIHPRYNAKQALVESDRCYFCHDAPCVTACPTSIDIPLFIREIKTGNALGAAKTILTQNIMGGMCARVCPTEQLCEEVCVRNTSESKPITIGRLQRYAVDALLDAGVQPFVRGSSTGKRVAVVGAGPAGLSCAHRLALKGHAVTLFDARAKLGGLNEYGIAAYKTVDDFAAREAAFILSLGGIEVQSNKRLGLDIHFDQLRRDFDAVFLGLGMAGVNDLGIEGESIAGVRDAVEYIAELRQAKSLGQLEVGSRVVVIGGGMTAIDIAVQSKLLGAEEVTLVYRRGAEQMGASRYEKELAQTNGVVIRFFATPKNILSVDGNLTSVEFSCTELQDGRVVETGETFILPADMLFKAIGQRFVAEPVSAGSEALALESNRIKVNVDRQTSLSNVWAGGDCVAGGQDLTVAAVEDGKVAAEAIDRFLLGRV